MATFIRGANRTLTGEGEPRVANGWIVSHDLFELTGFRASEDLPIGLFFTDADPRSRHGSMRMLGRLAEGVTADQAEDDLDGILGRLALDDPGLESDRASTVVGFPSRRIRAHGW